MEHIRLQLAMAFLLSACQTAVPPKSEKQQVHDKIVQNLFPWNKATEVMIFSFELDKDGVLRDESPEGHDALRLLNKKAGYAKGFAIKQRWRGSIAKGNIFMDTVLRNLRPEDIPDKAGTPNAKQCAFTPHHAICFLDKNNKIFAYELVCFWCAKRRSYGGDLGFTGTYKSLYRFCQFNGLDWELMDPFAMDNFATKEEKACYRLRKFPEEKLVCKGESRLMF